jgi:LysM repeat protein
MPSLWKRFLISSDKHSKAFLNPPQTLLQFAGRIEGRIIMVSTGTKSRLKRFTMNRPRRLISLFFSVIFLLLVTSLSAQAQQQTTYVVQRGDTLAKIAARYGTSWRDIAVVNNIANPNLIYAGQILVIPSYITLPAQSYTVRSGDTVTSIAASFRVTVDQLVQTNNLEAGGAYIYAGQVLVIPARTVPVNQPPVPLPTPTPVPPAPLPTPIPSGQYYFVQRGDTMFRIARAFGVNIYDLAEVNGILNLNRINVGQRLRIP